MSPQAKLSLIFLQSHPLQLRINRPRLRICPKRTTEQQNVWFGAVDGIMLPAAGLLNADGSPFVFAEEACFGESFCELFGENYVSVCDELLFYLDRVQCNG